MKKQMHIFGDAIEQAAIEQFKGAMACDFAIAGALMPDAHKGYALPIGGVVATDNVILPSWVGYDIGCGMCAIPMTTSENALFENREEIFKRIYDAVPTGFSHNRNMAPSAEGLLALEHTEVIADQLCGGALKQIGSLGSGNHFIEIGVTRRAGVAGEERPGQVWIILHSGSRNVGHKTCTHYMKLASPDGKAREDHFGFRLDTDRGQDYWTDLNFCLEFALANRREIIARVAGVIERLAGGSPVWEHLINRNHNHAERKNGMIIHRKGATHAEDGMMGVIPGNMRDGSFIVRGKGNPLSLWSSSHGAGRVLSRTKAFEQLNVEDFTDTMRGITAKVGRSTLDEAPAAYKDIFEVMRLQSDLVEVVAHVRPIINIKA